MSDTTSPDWIRIENNSAERLQLVGACTVRLQRTTRSRPWVLLPVWLALGLFLGWLFDEEGLLAGVNGQALAIFALLICGLQFLVMRLQMKRLAADLPATFSLALEEEGVVIDTQLGYSHIPWSALQGIECNSGGALIYQKGCRAFFVPRRSFADDADFSAWLRSVESCSGLKASASPPLPLSLPEKRGLRALEDLAQNLKAGFLFAFFHSEAVATLRVSILQIVLLQVLGLLIGLGYDLHMVGFDGRLNAYALPYQSFSVLCVLLCAWAVSNCSTLQGRIPAAVLALLASGLVIQAPILLAFALLQSTPAAQYLEALNGIVLLWMALVSIVALVRTLELPADQRMGAVLGVSFMYVVALSLNLGQARLWVPDYSGQENANATNRWEAATDEGVLYAQPALLERALAAIRPGRAGVPELYLLALGGYGAQDVFRREVESVEALFAERFNTQGRSVVLLNNPATVQERPVASTIALQRALSDIGRKMNREEDVLFLFMTSHGAADHHFSLDLWPFRFGELTPQSLRAALDEAGIQNRVIVVSACYSGGFVEPLQDAHTLVMTASRADRNSHGCSHAADWTFFGKAYFDEALRQSHSFTAAFEQARQSVARREKEEGLEASEPQISVGAAIQPLLNTLEKTGARGL
ncbi:C13 family peptidase [Uliginosibacterium aquaticum]|uniref:YcxB family protein n=1 Tax=Uliginosibacterium aquaticum TaxID=2731212 RepID=A0ABX2IJ79_9RHOO|nr:C13 family peptidase [Uliginosibacterium aquaticum]NSL56849.1 YcxB family protein [Uliginosibacterium aquaticum]